MAAVDIARILARVPGAVALDVTNAPNELAQPARSTARASISELAEAAGRSAASGASETAALDITRTWRDRVQPARVTATLRPAVTTATLGGFLVVALAFSVLSLRNNVPSQSSATAASPELAPIVRETPALPATQPRPMQPPPARNSAGPASRHVCPGDNRDVGGDGCDDVVTIYGNVIQVNARWFRAGDPGDIVVVGDWVCDGRITPAVLRPATGAVFVFMWWSGPSGTLEAPAIVTHPGATGIEALGRDGCDELVLVNSVGERVTVPVASS